MSLRGLLTLSFCLTACKEPGPAPDLRVTASIERDATGKEMLKIAMEVPRDGKAVCYDRIQEPPVINSFGAIFAFDFNGLPLPYSGNPRVARGSGDIAGLLTYIRPGEVKIYWVDLAQDWPSIFKAQSCIEYSLIYIPCDGLSRSSLNLSDPNFGNSGGKELFFVWNILDRSVDYVESEMYCKGSEKWAGRY